MGPDFLGALALDRAQVVTECDAAFCSVFGCESVVGKTLDELLSPRDRAGAVELAARLGRAEPVDVLVTLRLADTDHLARVRLQPRAEGFALYAERVGGAEDLVHRLTVAVERLKDMVRSSEDGIARDLANARAFQRMILGKPPQIATHDIEIAYRPVAQVGGDVYDVALLPDQRVRLFIADATGHGVTAALVTMLVKSAYDAVKLAGRPSDVLARLNDRVADSARSLDAMFTAAVVDVDLAAKRIVHASAAHLPPLLVDESGVSELECGGTFMGVSSGRVYPSWSRPLPDGAAIYLLTDGLAEARRPDGEQFGEARVRRALVEAVGAPSGGGSAVLAQLDAWLRPGVPDDDITILALRPRYA